MWKYIFLVTTVIAYILIYVWYIRDKPSPKVTYRRTNLHFNLTQHGWDKTGFQQIMLRTLKQVGIACRYERNRNTSANLQFIISRLKRKIEILNDNNTPNVNDFTEKITLVLNFVTEINVNRFDTIINGIAKSRYKDVGVVIAIDNKQFLHALNVIEVRNAVIIHLDNTTSHSEILIQLLSHVKTEFVVICRNIMNFNNYVSLEKLMHPLFHNYGEFIGASHRNIFGHWELGCFQTNMLWYRYRLVKGYDLSFKNYVYCDYLGGPFAAKTSLLKQQMRTVSTSNVQGDALYLDLMTNLKLVKIIIMSCIDCVFNVESFGMQNIVKLNWQPFAIKYKLNLIIFASNNTLYFSCNEMKADRKRSNGRFLTYCHHKEMNDAAIFTAKIYDKFGIKYELNAGSVLGSVKLDNTLLWELDHDFKVRFDDFEKLMNLTSVFRNSSYSLVNRDGNRLNCRYKMFCRFGLVRTGHWFLEMMGTNMLSSELYGNNLEKIRKNLTDSDKLGVTSVRGKRTLSRLGNAWISTNSNPGGFARGKYGVEILQHVQHWRDIHTSVYKPGKWAKCNKPGFHGCAEIFLEDGNLQFRTVWV